MNLLIFTQKVDRKDSNLGFFHGWIEEFGKKADCVFVICGQKGKYNLPQNVHVFSMGKERSIGRPARYINFYKYLFQNVRKADVIFVHMIPAWAILICPVALIFRKKIFLWYTHKSVTLSLRIAEKIVKNIFTASKESCRINSKKIIITGHGIDTERFVPNHSNESVGVLRNNILNKSTKLLAIGRISESKNLDFLIDLMVEIAHRNIDAALDIVGDIITPKDVIYKKRLEEKINKNNLNGDIRFLGAKRNDEMPAVYNSHDILLHVSETGSVDKTVLEAMSCGLPILVTGQAFKDIVPREYYTDKNVDKFLEKIVKLEKNGKNLVLREVVVKDHNLNNLIDKILNKIGNG